MVTESANVRVQFSLKSSWLQLKSPKLVKDSIIAHESKMKESHDTVPSSKNVSTLDMVICASQWMQQLCRSTRRSVGSSQVKLDSVLIARLGPLSYACSDGYAKPSKSLASLETTRATTLLPIVLIHRMLIVLRQELNYIIASSSVFCWWQQK
jgi:hypothetical protein